MSTLLTTAQVAEQLGTYREKVLRAVRRGDLAPVHKAAGIRGPYLFDADDVAAFAAKEPAK